MIEIRKAKKDELSGLIPVYKEAFEKHGIFTKPPEEILDYLENADGDFIIAMDDSNNKIIGGLLVVKSEPDTDHILARIKHLAVVKEFHGQGLGKGLIKEAKKEVGKGKIELHVSENEKEIIGFYEKMGFKIEGELSNHYRENEVCYILGITVNNE